MSVVLNPHEVVIILDKPTLIKQIMDHTTIEYWSVSAVMKNKDDVYNSVVTFENEEDALKLKVGDVFFR